MNIKNRKLKGYVALSVLIIVCVVMASAMTFYMPKNSANSANVGAKTPSVLNLDASGTAQDYFSSALTGAQNEYIYYGTNITGVSATTSPNAAGANNTHTGAIKWRVLTTNSKYSSGNLLLWSDYCLGVMKYNPYGSADGGNPDYAYWGTSMIRATLNGKTYYTGNSSTAVPTTPVSVSASNSYLKIFSDTEKVGVATADSYTTTSFGWTDDATPIYATTSIVANADNVAGKYNSTRINDKTNHPTAAEAQVVGTGVVETSSGDYLFLLDYYDVNNPLYGFIDSDTNKTFATTVNPSWILNSSAGYPSFNDNTAARVNYLKFPGDISTGYFLRTTGRWQNAISVANYVGADGYVHSAYTDHSTFAVRPAFNLDLEKVVYATAAGHNGATFAKVDNTISGKPEYKVYMQANGYVNYNNYATGAPKITVNDDKLSVEKSDASGYAIILLADKSGSGVVEYQATVPFSSGVATVTLPSGKNARDYCITALLADSVNGGVYSESIKGSYTVSGNTVVPQESKDKTKYKAFNDTTDVSFDLENVYNKSIADNTTEWVDITIEGENYKGEEVTVADSKWTIDASHKLTFNVSEVGDYTVKITPKSGYSWADGTTAAKEYKYRLKYKLTALSWDKNNITEIAETYNGEDQYFVLKNYDKDIAELLTLSPAPVKVSKDGGGKVSADENGTLYAIKVKDYEKDEKVTVSLNTTYQDYLVWDETNYPTASKELTYSINKKKLTASPLATDWKIQANDEEEKNRIFYLLIDGICKEDDLTSVSFAGYSKKGSEDEQSVSPAPEFIKDGDGNYETQDGKYKLKVVLPKISAGDYTYILKPATTSSKNYYLENEDNNKYEKAFSTSNKSIDITAEDIVWQYKNYLLTDNDFKTIEAGDNITVETSGSDKIFCATYNENAFSFDVDKTSEDSKLKPYASDVDFTVTILGSDGNVINGEDGKPITSITDVMLKDSKATNYTLKLKITAKEGKTVDIKTSEFTLKFKINQAVFDLSDVKWDYDPEKPREYNGGKDLKVSLTGLPVALNPNYYDDDAGEDSNVNSKVCEIDSTTKEYTPYTAKVVFEFNEKLGNIAEYKNNYILPNKDDTSSYICKEKNDDGDLVDKAFPWELEWVVKKAELDLTTDWEKVAQKDDNGNVFRPFQVKATSKATGKIIYEYYKEDEWDNVNGVVLGSATPKTLEDIVVDFDNPEKYWVVAKVNTTNSGNYEIKRSTEAKKFTVGAGTLIEIEMDKEFVYDGKEHGLKSEFKFEGKGNDETEAIKDIIIKKYYLIEKGEDGEDKQTELAEGEVPTKAGVYIVSIDFEDEEYQDKYALSSYNITFEITQAELTISLTEKEFVFNDGNVDVNLKITCDNKLDVSNVKIKKTYYLGDEIKEDGSNMLTALPKNVGKYIVVLSIDETDEDNFRNYKIKEGCTQFSFEITSAQITAVWDTTGDTPVLSGLTEEEAELIEYIYLDEDGNEYEKSQLEAGKTYTAVARIKEEYADNYVFVDKKGNVLTVPTETEKTFEIKADAPTPVDPTTPDEPTPSDDALGDLLAKFKDIPLWQLIVGIICIILTIIFLSKTAKYDGERKKFKKKSDKLDSMYAGAFLGVATTIWTAIACVLIALAVVSFVMMIIAKSRRNKAEEEFDEANEEYAKSQKDAESKQMQMMLMGMMGGNPNGQNGQGFAYQQPQFALDDIRGIVADTMSNMLPTVTQYLPQEASYNDELVQQLIDQNAQNEERMRQMSEQNEKAIEKLVEKLSAQQTVEQAPVKEVAAAGVNDEVIKSLLEGQKAIMEKLSKQDEDKQPVKVIERDSKDEKIEMLMRNQEMLMRQMMEMSGRNNDKQVVMPYMPQPTLVQQPAEKIIIEKPVEKIVEKEVRVEVPVPMPVEKPAKASKAPAPRLTLDEAYAKLSASQKKIFDTLRNYALSKDKCKENKSTYFTVLGQSSVNPLVKLTIKKNTTVALFKMEDEYMKDIRKNATSDGSKIKVKETELVVSDNQALSTAKDMIDLREDQIERYNDYLKEQKSMRKK